MSMGMLSHWNEYGMSGIGIGMGMCLFTYFERDQKVGKCV